ncbi:hypothetical protein ACFTY8_48815 [Streptomyces mirabilis]|uniref:hypothetical protein n=1 Tax=Streptomyces mirabilis TaxID=68239 RepID=UPI00363D78EA
MRSRRMSPVSGPVREREERALTDSEPVCLDLVQGLLGHRSGARWLRFARST